MKKILIWMLISGLAGGYVAHKNPGLFSHLLVETYQLGYQTYMETQPTTIDREPLDEMLSLEVPIGKSTRQLGFLDVALTVDIYAPSKRGTPFLVLIPDFNQFTNLEKTTYIEQALQAEMTVLVPHYSDVTQVHWLEAVRRTVEMTEVISNGNRNQVAVVGWGFGGRLAISLTKKDERIRALGLYGDFLDPQLDRKDFLYFPPTWIHLGGQTELEASVKSLAHWFGELRILNVVSQKHTLTETLAREEWNEALAFLNEHLSQSEPIDLTEALEKVEIEKWTLMSGEVFLGKLSSQSKGRYLILSDDGTHRTIKKSDLLSREKTMVPVATL